MGIEYSLGADDTVGDGLSLVSAEDPREAEVRDLGVHIRVQQDVAGLKVTVDNFELGVFVEVLQTPSDAVYDPVPLVPIKLLTSLILRV